MHIVIAALSIAYRYREMPLSSVVSRVSPTSVLYCSDTQVQISAPRRPARLTARRPVRPRTVMIICRAAPGSDGYSGIRMVLITVAQVQRQAANGSRSPQQYLCSSRRLKRSRPSRDGQSANRRGTRSARAVTCQTRARATTRARRHEDQAAVLFFDGFHFLFFDFLYHGLFDC